MNNCLCESCCDKDYCLIYQDYKNPDGILTEPITACGRYKKLYTVEDTYTKEEVITMLTELQVEIEKVPKYCMTHDTIFVYRKAEEYISDINNVIQQKIDNLKEVSNEQTQDIF